MKYSCSYICVCKCISIYVKMYVFICVYLCHPTLHTYAYANTVNAFHRLVVSQGRLRAFWNAVPTSFGCPPLEREKDPFNSFPGKLANIISNGTSPFWGKQPCLFFFPICMPYLRIEPRSKARLLAHGFVQHPPDLPPFKDCQLHPASLQRHLATWWSLRCKWWMASHEMCLDLMVAKMWQTCGKKLEMGNTFPAIVVSCKL